MEHRRKTAFKAKMNADLSGFEHGFLCRTDAKRTETPPGLRIIFDSTKTY